MIDADDKENKPNDHDITVIVMYFAFDLLALTLLLILYYMLSNEMGNLCDVERGIENKNNQKKMESPSPKRQRSKMKMNMNAYEKSESQSDLYRNNGDKLENVESDISSDLSVENAMGIYEVEDDEDDETEAMI